MWPMMFDMSHNLFFWGRGVVGVGGVWVGAGEGVSENLLRCVFVVKGREELLIGFTYSGVPFSRTLDSLNRSITGTKIRILSLSRTL